MGSMAGSTGKLVHRSCTHDGGLLMIKEVASPKLFTLRGKCVCNRAFMFLLRIRSNLNGFTSDLLS